MGCKDIRKRKCVAIRLNFFMTCLKFKKLTCKMDKLCFVLIFVYYYINYIRQLKNMF